MQTELYCITMAKFIFGAKGEFVGIFAVDFYIDSLTQVLGASYTKDSCAFLVDRNGVNTLKDYSGKYRLLRWQAAVNRQLKNASDTALAANQAKSQFLAQMSHEIRYDH